MAAKLPHRFFTAAFFLFCLSASAQEPAVVPVGKGSYAAAPPAQADEKRQGDRAGDMDKWPVQVDPSVAGLPVPTNQWWTSVIVRPFSGTIWPYPLAVRPEPSGVRVFFPIAWNGGGNDMPLERPLAIRADSSGQPAGGRADILLGDFEGMTYPMGWEVKGKAFGSGPSRGPVDGQGPFTVYSGKALANSFHGGDSSTGSLTLRPFVIERKRIQFFVGGGSNKEQLGVRLLVDGAVVRQACGNNLEAPVVTSWDVAELQGKKAQIAIVDEATGGWGHILADQFVLTDKDPPAPGAADETTTFRAKACRALRWGDWSLTLRMPGEKSESEFLDVTLGRGMPYCWVDFHETAAVVETFKDAAFETADGRPAVFPIISDRVVVAFPDRKFAVFAPPGSKILLDVTRLRIQFSGPLRRIAICPLPKGLRADVLAGAAMTPPLDTRLTWTYDPSSATVRTKWDLTLDGGGKTMLQGWLPHHYRDGKSETVFDGPEFLTPRGTMRCASGTGFQFDFPFQGILPALPSPAGGGFDTARLTGYLADFAQKWRAGEDSYWGGKDMLRAGQCLDIAAATGQAAIADDLKQKLRGALADWFTYTPGEPAHYFARYSRWKALVGFRDSYGSVQFNDHHFHYGYFTMASSLLALHDPSFLPDFGPMATLVAKEYANWDRNDREFPFLRTFDIWEGHSNASGFSGPNGNNQESSSEAMQSWAGLFLLGSALGNDAMRDAGAMGFAMERAATMQYWFNYSASKDGPAASNWSPAYKHGTVGILFSGGLAFATFFSGDPGWIYGIQWFPPSASLDYLAADPAFSKRLYGRMWEERETWLQREAAARNQTYSPDQNTVAATGADLGSVLLGYQLQFDPAAMLEELDRLWAAGNPVASDPNAAAINYFLAYAKLALGPRQWEWSASVPTAAVYKNPASGALTYIAVNYSDKPVEVTFKNNGAAAGTFLVPPKKLVSSGALRPDAAGPQ